MNRYAAAGIALDAMQGRSVVVITDNTADERATIDYLEDVSPKTDLLQISRTNGKATIRYQSGGRVYVRRSLNSLRGATADTVYLDTGVDAHLDAKDYDSLAAIIATSPHADIIRA